MSIIIILLGYVLWQVGARIHFGAAANGGQNLGAGILTLIVQCTGVGMIIWGAVKLFF